MPKFASTMLLLVVLGGLGALVTPRLIAAGLNNLASRELASEWGPIAGAGRAPRCLPHRSQSGAQPAVVAALRLDPTNERALVNLGRVYWLEGRCDAALVAWRGATEHGRTDQTAALLLATGQYVTGDTAAMTRLLGPDQAIEYASGNEIQAALLGNQADVAFWSELIFAERPARGVAERLTALYFAQGRPRAAIAVWQRLADVRPMTDPEHWWALGQAATLGQDWLRAAAAYERGAPIAADPYPYWLQAGYASLNGREGARAEIAFANAHSIRPEAADPPTGLGRAKYLQNDFVSALAWLRRAEQLAPEAAEPKFWMGLTQLQQQDCTQARQTFQRVLEIDPRHTSSRYFLAVCDYRLGRLQEAIGGMEQAIAAVRAGSPVVLPWDWAVLLGDWQLQAGDKASALSSYRLALEWHPGDPAILKRIEAAR